MYVLRCCHVSESKRVASQKPSVSSSFAPFGGTFPTWGRLWGLRSTLGSPFGRAVSRRLTERVSIVAVDPLRPSLRSATSPIGGGKGCPQFAGASGIQQPMRTYSLFTIHYYLKSPLPYVTTKNEIFFIFHPSLFIIHSPHVMNDEE